MPQSIICFFIKQLVNLIFTDHLGFSLFEIYCKIYIKVLDLKRFFLLIFLQQVQFPGCEGDAMTGYAMAFCVLRGLL